MSGLAHLLLFPGIDSVAAPALDADYQAVLDRATTLGYAKPSSGQQAKHSTLVTAIKAAGAWAKLLLFRVYANDGSKEFGTLNWINPLTFQATYISSPTFTSNQGMTGDGVAAYLDEGINLSTQGGSLYTQNSGGRGAWVYAATTGNIIEGMVAGGDRMLSSNASTHRINQGMASLSAAADMSGTGLRAMYRTNPTDVECFSDLTQISRTATSDALINSQQTSLRSASLYSVNTIAIRYIGAPLVAEHAALHAALSAYMASPS